MKKKKHGLPAKFHVNEVGMVRIGRRNWVIGTSPLRRHGLRGTCLTPKRRGLPHAIVISSHMRPGSPKQREAIIHEMLHAAFPEATERHVETTANAIAQTLGALSTPAKGAPKP